MSRAYRSVPDAHSGILAEGDVALLMVAPGGQLQDAGDHVSVRHCVSIALQLKGCLIYRRHIRTPQTAWTAVEC